MKYSIARSLLLLALAFCILAGGALPASQAFAASADNPVSTAKLGPVNTEYLILSGGPSLMQWEKWKAQPHDIWWMNFVRAARIRVQQLLMLGVSPKQITWLVYVKGYKSRSQQDGQNLIANIASVQNLYGINLKFFENSSEVIDYINYGKPRGAVRIADFEYFGHSNKACWMFDYSNNIDSASKVWIHEDDFKKINRDAFTKDAFVMSWGCHSGEEMSQKFRKAIGIKMWGALGRTQYNTDVLPTLATADGKWTY